MRPLEGVRVVEMAAWVFVPMAGSILADWGADVVKVEHPLTGDPMRGLKATGQAGSQMTPATNFQLMNRGKRSVGIDVSSDEGREILYKLVEGADVFTTNLLPPVRRKLQIDVEDIRRQNPNIIYAKGSGVGAHGPQYERAGFDFATYWSRGGVAAAFQAENPSSEYPPRQLGGFGDFPAGAILAGGIAAALAGRAVTGEPSVVDGSLLSYGAWQVSTGIVEALQGDSPARSWPTILRTADDKYLALTVPAEDDDFRRLCADLEQRGLADDARFIDAASRWSHRVELFGCLKQLAGERSLQQWADALRDAPWDWQYVQTVEELTNDPQLAANEYIVPLQGEAMQGMRAVCGPVQFDESAPTVREGPTELGGSTDDVLLGIGYSWDDLIQLKLKGAIL